ncbi:MAG: histidine kinase [Spirochaetes bacterium GWB1_48_6]|nr:MAG: histidine kinase [Spirochaetes bacterium GWB1_48_6]
MAKRTKKTKIFSALEVANICGVVNQTAINWIKNDYLKAFTTPGGQYRVYADDLLAFLEERSMRIPKELEALLEELKDSSFLIIDDDKDLNNLMVQKLTKAFPDFAMDQAFDGFEAGSLLNKRKPAVVVLDINLPGVNGLTICKNIKTDPAFGKPVVIVVSGVSNPSERLALLNEGAEGYFAKPVVFEDLVATIESCLGKR